MPALSTSQPVMKLRGVKVHNLQDISLDIPLHQLVAITGISGSGKSSLAFATIFAEGQRMLLETLPTTIQASLAQLERPRATALEAIPPAFMIRQRGVDLDLDISIGNWTGLNQLLREYFITHGRSLCPNCNSPVINHTPATLLELVNQLPQGSRFQLGFVVPVHKKPDVNSTTKELNLAGFHRTHLIDNPALLAICNQLATSQTQSAGISSQKSSKSKSASMKQALMVIADRLLAGNISADRVLESMAVCLREGAGLCLLLTESANRPTSADSCIKIEAQTWHYTPLILGYYCNNCHTSLSISHDVDITSSLSHQAEVNFTMDDFAWQDVIHLPLCNWPVEFRASLQRNSLDIRTSQILKWLDWLEKLHLQHLAFDTKLSSLATGEAQRLNLARAVNLGLTQTMFVVDEPCAGTHPAERLAIYQAIKQLKETGNSVIVVEHDEQLLKLADQIIDLGPEAGSTGGKLVFQGTYQKLLACTDSLTSRWINNKTVEKYGATNTHRWLTAPELVFTQHASSQAQPYLTLPLQRLVAITGLSGTGKRRLLHQMIFQGICRAKNWGDKLTEEYANMPREDVTITGLNQIDDCILMTGRPRKAHRTQTLVTGIDLFTEIRQLMAQTHEAKLKGYKPGDFSFSSAKGKKCTKCQGQGVILLQFPQLAPQQSVCPMCQGGRFQPQMQEILYRGLSISQLLNLTIDDAFQFFRNIPKLQKGLFALKEAGLGYLTLGRNLHTLSGGEYQRFLLAQRILAGSGDRILFLFEEPSIGLHPENKHQLLKLFFHLLELGHSVVILENDLQLLNACEHKITTPL